jgi:hypothetical protein
VNEAIRERILVFAQRAKRRRHAERDIYCGRSELFVPLRQWQQVSVEPIFRESVAVCRKDHRREDVAVEQRMHVAVQAFTSRCTRRAASRIVTGPAPAKARINSHRFAVNSWNRSSGAAQLMREPCFLPLKASCARRLTSSSLET